MIRISSKYLNLRALAALVNDDSTNCNGVLLIIPSGVLIGELSIDSESSVFSNTVVNIKEKLLNKYMEEFDDVKLIGDGSSIALKNSSFINSSNNIIISTDEITVHCSDIIAFMPINLDDYKKQLQQKAY
ncbi:hypothetical protein [Clostridium perfringens]|nr:hypothetical protein [Clostridium perfringens]MCX0412817.1 hypothetical protein [Clostridium perfringens]MDB2039188.1 hypothetical protein [Clostridium perfringens]MDB2048260.1 hypothetical protein [Clostridium perfringens]MDM0714621.1 hypothetical protein [Clostridium perfringens]MDM0736422.1 hypothetical protein [Clostridium perfringens]